MPTSVSDITSAIRPVEAGLSLVSDTINDIISDSDPRLGCFLDYLKDTHGKMLRPAMLLLCCQAFSNAKPIHIKVAAIIEMTHAATLLHDDVIDSAQSRRHKPTANQIWNPRIAILLGDFLLSRAFAISTTLGRSDVSEILAKTTDEICRGEMLQGSQRNNFDITVADYIEIIDKKTAVFFSASCQLGALLADADEESVENLSAFGLNFGIAFQIADDLVDIIGDESTAGKTLMRDIAQNNLTLPIIHALSVLPPDSKAELIDSLTTGVATSENLNSLLTSAGSIKYTISQIDAYVEKAIKHLNCLSDDSARKSLTKLAQAVIPEKI